MNSPFFSWGSRGPEILNVLLKGTQLWSYVIVMQINTISLSTIYLECFSTCNFWSVFIYEYLLHSYSSPREWWWLAFKGMDFKIRLPQFKYWLWCLLCDLRQGTLPLRISVSLSLKQDYNIYLTGERGGYVSIKWDTIRKRLETGPGTK